MDQTDNNLEERIAAEQAKVSVESYQKPVSMGGWSGGGRTFWAISIVGGLTGAAMGLVAPFFPLLVNAGSLSTALGAVGTSVAAFTAVGMGIGFSGGAVLGRISGAAAAAAQEQEKRMKDWIVRQKIVNNPEAEIAPDPVKEPEPLKPLWERIKDNYRTYINPRVGVTMAALGAVGGLIIAAASVLTDGASGALVPGVGMEALTGLTASAITPAVVTAYTTGVMASFGALWALNYPKITSDFTQAMGDLMNGTTLNRKWEPMDGKDPQPIFARAQDYAPEPEQPSRQFQDMLAAQKTTEQGVQLQPR